MDEPVIGAAAGREEPEPEARQLEAPELEASAAVEAAPEASEFRPGAHLQVAYVGPNRRAAFNSTVVGFEGGLLALDLERLPLEQPLPPVDDAVILVSSTRGRYTAFDAAVREVREVGGDPKALLVTPPVEARRPERRASMRVPLSIPLRSGTWLDPVGAQYAITGARLLDISTGGALLRTQQQIPPGSVLRLVFSLYPAERAMLAQAMVTGVDWDEARIGASRLHVQFIEMSDENRAQLDRFVASAAARMPKSA